MKITKKEVLIGVLAIAAVVIAGCTQIRESASQPRELIRPPLQEEGESEGEGVTYQGVLDMLNECDIVEFNGNYIAQTCDNKCSSNITSKVCVAAYRLPNGTIEGGVWDGHLRRSTCDYAVGFGTLRAQCVCCSLPGDTGGNITIG